MPAPQEVQEDGVLVSPKWMADIVARLEALEGPKSGLQTLGVTSAPNVPKTPDAPRPVFPYIVTGNTLLSTDHWDYDVKAITSGDSTHHGLFSFGDAIKARNTAEKESKGGYVSGAVSALQPIKAGKVVYCWRDTIKVGGVMKSYLLFSLDNEPIC